METKYESDLTKKEKRQMEWQKIKSMGMREKLEYLWTYYKYVLAILIGIIMLISVLWTSYKNRNINYVFSMAVVDAYYNSEDNVDKLKEEILQLVGTGDKHESVFMDMSATTITEDDYNEAMKILILLSASDLDLFFCSEEIYEGYYAEEAFLEWEEVLGADYEKYEPYITNGYLDFSKSEKWKEYGFTLYEPVCAGVVVNAPNVENAKKVVEYFFENE